MVLCVWFLGCVCKVKNRPFPPLQGEGQGGDGLRSSTPAGVAKRERAKTDQKRNLSERSEFISLPVLALSLLGTRRATTGGRLSLLPFFGEAKKGSGPPGPVPASLFEEPQALH